MQQDNHVADNPEEGEVKSAPEADNTAEGTGGAAGGYGGPADATEDQYPTSAESNRE